MLTYTIFFFFFNDTATTEIYTLSLHDALPISLAAPGPETTHYGGNTSCVEVRGTNGTILVLDAGTGIRRLGADRKSTRLNSSHDQISYAVFCLKKKKNRIIH